MAADPRAADGERIDPETRNPDGLYRTFDFGDPRSAGDDRHPRGRPQQATRCNAQLVGAYTGAPPQGPFPLDVHEGWPRPGPLMGDTQEAWFTKQIKNATQTWQLIGNRC